MLQDWKKVINLDNHVVKMRELQEELTGNPPQEMRWNDSKATFFGQQGGFGYGMCMRDSLWQFCLSSVDWKHVDIPIREGEALVVLASIKWLMDLDTWLAFVEINCKQVVDALKCNSGDFFEFGSIISQCKVLLCMVPNFQVSFVRRQAILEAHALARASRNYACLTSFCIIPYCIVGNIINETS